MLAPVVRVVLQGKLKEVDNDQEKSGKSEKENDLMRVDDLSYQESKQYQKKMGAWRRRTAEVVEDSLWFVVAECMRMVKGPVLHLSASWLVFLFLRVFRGARFKLFKQTG